MFIVNKVAQSENHCIMSSVPPKRKYNLDNNDRDNNSCCGKPVVKLNGVMFESIKYQSEKG